MHRRVARWVGVAVLAVSPLLLPASTGRAAAPSITTTSITSITVSPGFSSDHTVFASGTDVNSPLCLPCNLLFRSGDGGHTWVSVGGLDFPGGAILLPPHFPTDPTLYVDDGMRSDDGGATFLPISALSGPTAMLPGGTAGHARLVIAGPNGLYVYDEASRLTTPGPLYPVARLSVEVRPVQIVTVAAATVLVLDASGGMLTCRLGGGGCAVADDPSSWVAAPPTPDGLALSAHGSRNIIVRRTLDAGRTFTTLQTLPVGAYWGSIAFSTTNATDHTMLVHTYPGDNLFRPYTALQLSTDDGATLSGFLAENGLPVSPMITIGGMAFRPDGSIMVGLVNLSLMLTGLGVWCSTDQGATFAVC